jgi:hypothetical protein
MNDLSVFKGKLLRESTQTWEAAKDSPANPICKKSWFTFAICLTMDMPTSPCLMMKVLTWNRWTH